MRNLEIKHEQPSLTPIRRRNHTGKNILLTASSAIFAGAGMLGGLVGCGSVEGNSYPSTPTRIVQITSTPESIPTPIGKPLSLEQANDVTTLANAYDSGMTITLQVAPKASNVQFNVLQGKEGPFPYTVNADTDREISGGDPITEHGAYLGYVSDSKGSATFFIPPDLEQKYMQLLQHHKLNLGELTFVVYNVESTSINIKGKNTNVGIQGPKLFLQSIQLPQG